jgi:2-polyprenyl-3-methyl-5-hydroxy-6-metoxy-1,4-benzoquinol methylase
MQGTRIRRHGLGFWELANKPSAQELATYYEETYYQNETANYRKSYSALETEVIELRIALRAAQIGTLRGSSSPGSMLDVGCGEGFVIRYFRSLGWLANGIDYSRAGVEQMNPTCAELVEQGDVFQLLEARIAAGEQHDVVWLSNVLEHVLDPVGLLQSLGQLVKPNGVLLVTVPNDGSAFQEAMLDSGAIPERFWISEPDHISYFTADSLQSTIAAVGFKCLALHGDFPIDIYLAHAGSNYVTDRTRGPAAHQARLQLEQLIGQCGLDRANHFYAALGLVGLGRNITAYIQT